jgi:carboxypeptidase C (cathepsin A)
VDNPDSVLSVADLVFVDPVSTGYSRPEKGEKASDFHGFNEDLSSVAEFIRLWTTRNGRWGSAKFLAGESYGAFRAAGLASVLQDRFGMYLNGIVLVSGVLDFGTLWGTDEAHVCFLPTLAAVAQYHGALGDAGPQGLEALTREVEAFAEGEYASALLRGFRLPPEERSRLAARVAGYTGLDAGLVERLDLRVPPGRFREELLRDRGLVVGRFDGRLTGEDGDLAGTNPGFDPSHAAVTGAYSAMVKDYLHRELGFESDLVYEILTDKVQPWNYETFAGTTVKVTDKLAAAMAENRHLQVLVLCGYHDLATPHFSIRQSLDHLDLAPSLRENIAVRFYEGGHMMYTIDASNSAVNRDVREFVGEGER